MVTYAPHDILRRIDNVLLAEYARRHELFAELEIAKLKQTEVDPIYEAIQSLEPVTRERVLQDLRNVAIVADKRRIQRLFSALQHEGIAFPEFNRIRANFDKAIWALLNHPATFDGVLKYTFPFTDQRHWQRFIYPAGHTPAMDEDARERLCNGIKAHFRKYDGRSEHCRVEYHSFQDHDYLFAYPSEYPDQVPEWLENGSFERTQHRLAFMVIFVSPKDGTTLDLYIQEQASVKRDMIALWAKEILGLDNVDPKPKRAFNLTPFHSTENGITIPPESDVKSLAVYKLRFSPAHNPQATYTIEADISTNKRAVYDELENKRLGISYIKQVGLEARLQADGADKEMIRRFEISPGSCSLKHEDEAGVLRQFLKSNGIDTAS